VLLVHGFGASAGHYRKTIPYLAQNGFKVKGACNKRVLLMWAFAWFTQAIALCESKAVGC
jgi:hypothetical protein